VRDGEHHRPDDSSGAQRASNSDQPNTGATSREGVRKDRKIL
jgi:hypothetical protein